MEAGTIHIEDHTVIAALDALLLNSTVLQRSTTVAAVGMQHTYLAATVAKCHQLFAHDLQEARRIGELQRHADRVPEATQVLASWRAGAGFGQLWVMVRGVVGVVATVGDQLLGNGSAAAACATLLIMLIEFLSHFSLPQAYC